MYINNKSGIFWWSSIIQLKIYLSYLILYQTIFVYIINILSLPEQFTDLKKALPLDIITDRTVIQNLLSLGNHPFTLPLSFALRRSRLATFLSFQFSSWFLRCFSTGISLWSYGRVGDKSKGNVYKGKREKLSKGRLLN